VLPAWHERPRCRSAEQGDEADPNRVAQTGGQLRVAPKGDDGQHHNDGDECEASNRQYSRDQTVQGRFDVEVRWHAAPGLQRHQRGLDDARDGERPEQDGPHATS
jgi:hypothetical protein